MFGFGKKKQSNQDGKSLNEIAGESQKAIWVTKQEFFAEFNDQLVNDFDVVFEHGGTLMFFLEATQYDYDFMAYGFGFVFGFGQAHSKEEEFCHQAIPLFVRGHEKKIYYFMDGLGLKRDSKTYFELFMERMADSSLLESEAGSVGVAAGLADGKGFGDYQIAIQKDYSKLNDKEAAAKANLNGLRELLEQWRFGVMMNTDLMEAVKNEAHLNEK